MKRDAKTVVMHADGKTGFGGMNMPKLSTVAIIVFALSFSIMDVAFAQQRPTVSLERCEGTYNLGCKENFCVRVRTESWDQLPSSVEDNPEIYIQFSRKIRDQNGQPLQPLQGWRSKVTLSKGTDHDKTLWFQTDDGPLFLKYVDFGAYLLYPEPPAKASPENLHFDLKPAPSNKLWFRMEGENCRIFSWW